MGIGLGDVLKVAAHEDQATGAALAFSGGDAGTDTAFRSFEFGFLFRQFFPEILSFTLVLRLEGLEVPRLLMAWISTEAVRTQSRVLVLGDSLSDFMRELGIYSSDGKSIHPASQSDGSLVFTPALS